MLAGITGSFKAGRRPHGKTEAPPWDPTSVLAVAWIDASDTTSYSMDRDTVAWIDDKAGTYSRMTSSNGGLDRVGTSTHNSMPVFTFTGNSFIKSVSYEPQVNNGNHWAIGVFRFDTTNSTQDSFWSYETNAATSIKRDYAISSGNASNGWPGELDLEGNDVRDRISRAIGNKQDWDLGVNRYQWTIVACYFNKTGNEIGVRISGTNAFAPVNSYENSLQTNQELRLMRNRSSQELAGRLAEFIAVADIPGTGGTDLSELQKAEGYLAHKWGLAISLPDTHPYKNTPP